MPDAKYRAIDDIPVYIIQLIDILIEFRGTHTGTAILVVETRDRAWLFLRYKNARPVGIAAAIR